ncbi:flagellar biosynthesis protein FlhA [Luteimonas fraxinea]|uniref:Flagellar biosynthesis protein FlhA n=1 Tax=Luteimonas fraxinea TaxID=2901869 RepID=A0ABS8U8Z1_9GAMM|nr:flagellar biosynthesis protein FlhA [Luteimonas fraxinea]MCD9095549.1 flagellar biosynthesis protein FlhA [Luteimonas fraxinea]MCD9126210.1 flagellar biosynthesis protein FlhA [Luteimonas fraxinea]UHH11860.1 flagellar biosynthesis protein FlhA [Luteimonas fraxinea]
MKAGAAAPIVVLALLAMIIIPLAPPVLDALFTINIALSLVVMLAVVYVRKPLDFSIFPSVLLLVTLLRLALNVASTRVVLLHGHEGPGAAGKVIESFAHFVIGGSFAVGIIVFAILTIVNFVVVTKGAGRISEVSARFILDALPGKQMAIDADLNAGVLTREEAKARRQEVRDEADFYGSMDGASKFVRGDAIAGILILVINMVGGVLIGVLSHDMSFGEAMRTYTLLTIGDGLVAQLPALLVATAVAMLVTRSTGEQEMGEAVSKQVFGHQRALTVAAVMMFLIGIIPGMPNLPFLILAGILGFVAWKLRGAPEAEAQAKRDAEAVAATAASSPLAELSWDEIRPVEPLALEVGYKLIALVDKAQGGELLARLKGVRRKLTQDIGFLIPAVHVRDNLELAPGAYRVMVHGVPVAGGEIHPDRELALDPGRVFGPLDGIPGKDPAFGLDATWILPSQRAHAESLGYTVVDAATVVATHLSHLVRERSAELLGHDEVQQLLSTLSKATPKLVEDLTPKLLPLSVVVKVLQSLLADRVPVRQIRQIVETLLEHGVHTQDPAQLTAAVRVALGRFIVQELNGMAEEFPVYTLAPQLERVLQDSVNGQGAALEPGLAERLHQNLSECVTRQESRGEPAVLLVPGGVRASVARLVRHSVPSLSVLAYAEVPEDKRLRLVGAVG